MADILGTENPDFINGTPDADTIDGLGGNDTVHGLAGNDVIHGGTGADTLTGDDGDDTLFGDADNDILIGGEGSDTVNGGDGNDTLDGGNGVDILNGGLGDDVLKVDIWGFYLPLESLSVGDQFNGGDGIDTLFIEGSPYPYTATMFTLGTDLVYTGIERLNATGAAGFIGTIAQLSAFSSVSAMQVNLADSGLFTANGAFSVGNLNLSDAGNTVDLSASGAFAGNIYGGAGNDTIFGATAVLYPGTFLQIHGGGGNDIIWGGSSNDLIQGDAGDDVMHGGDGNDSFINQAGDDQFFGDAGDDYFHAGDLSSISANDWFYGGAGFDTIQIAATQGVSIDLSKLHLVDVEKLVVGGAISMTTQQIAQFQAIECQDLTILNSGSVTMTSAPAFIHLNAAGNTVDLSLSTEFHQVVGGAASDTVYGGSSYEFLYGNGGDDLIVGNGGDDFIDGGTGTDRMYGGEGNDHFMVERQQDIVFENAGEGYDWVEASSNFYLYDNIEKLTLTSTAGAAFGVGNDLDNLLEGNNSDNLLIGGGGNDSILGAWGDDTLYGQDGNDTISGDLGIDYLAGGAGDDVLDGGWDSDAIYGEDGNDTLTGGGTFDTDLIVGGAGNDIIYANSGLGDFDILNGGAGNDTYYVDTPADVIYEGVGEGIDTVYASIDGAGYYLWAEVENCVLVGATPFAAGNALNNVLTGSDSANWLLGNDGNDVLIGKGGNDVLFGDRPGGTAGQDLFVFEAGSGQDVIGDFHHGEDRIQLIGGYASFTEVSSHFIQNGADGAIDLGGGNFIVLNGVTMSTLTASDFLFG